jgi:hypothetical protein
MAIASKDSRTVCRPVTLDQSENTINDTEMISEALSIHFKTLKFTFGGKETISIFSRGNMSGFLEAYTEFLVRK